MEIKKKRSIGKRCVAYGCSNSTMDGFSLFSFPKEAKYNALWTAEVKKLRKDFVQPSAYSCLCDVHFSNEMYKPSCLLKREMGISTRMYLLPTAIPVIAKPDAKRPLSSKPVRPAAAKRQRKQVRTKKLLIPFE